MTEVLQKRVMELIDGICTPDNMTAAEALEFLEEIREDITARIDILKDSGALP